MSLFRRPLIFSFVFYLATAIIMFVLLYVVVDDPFVEFTDTRGEDRPTLKEVLADMRTHWARSFNRH